MRRTPPALAARDGSRPALAWDPDEVPTHEISAQRSDDTWRSLDRLDRSSRLDLPLTTMPVTNTATTANRAGAYTSPDGSEWLWDGDQWQPVLPAPVRAKRWQTKTALLGGAAGLALLLTGGILAASHPGGTATRPEQVAIRGTLQTAGFAQLSYRTETLAYAGSLEDLILAGFEPVPQVTVTVVSATDSTFCLAAGPTGLRPVAWLTQDGESSTPCE